MYKLVYNKSCVSNYKGNSNLIYVHYVQYQLPLGEHRQTSNIRRPIVDNKIVDHSDVVGASPVGAAPTTSSFLTLVSMDWKRQLQDETRIS